MTSAASWSVVALFLTVAAAAGVAYVALGVQESRDRRGRKGDA